MLNNKKIEEMKNFLWLRGLKVTGKKRNLSSKSILCYRKQYYLSEDRKQTQKWNNKKPKEQLFLVKLYLQESTRYNITK